MNRRRVVRCWIVLALAAICLIASPAIAAPSITSVTPRGVQIGQPTTLVITGSDLSADIQLITEAKVATQKIKPGAKADRLELEMTIDSVTPPGLYAFRIADGG